MYEKNVDSNEIAIWGELVRRYITLYKGKDIAHWGQFNLNEISHLVEKRYIRTKNTKDNNIVCVRPTNEIMSLVLNPSIDIALKALEDTKNLDFGSCDTYVVNG